jgi:tetratricopeptide (TPR) repeat protein
MSRRPRVSIGACALLAVLAGGLEACGPWFPNRLLVEGDGFVRKAPVANFAVEIARSTAGTKSRFKAVVPRPDSEGEIGPDGYEQQTVQVDLADLRKALGPLTPARERAVRQYRAARFALMKAPTPGPGKPFTFIAPPLPTEIPAEFADYFRGAVLYDQGKTKEARDEWLHLLARPARERHYHSIWAAYMIGRALQEESPTEAAAWFARVRRLADEGYADSLGLAVTSLGWEAQTELGRKHYQQAFDLYTEQVAAGDPTAALSLVTVAREALKTDAGTLEQLAADGAARRAITAYITSLGGPYRPVPPVAVLRRWAAVIARARVFPAEDADRLAWAAYQAGEMDLARQWLQLARDTTMARWLRVKLLVCAGRVKQASAELAALARDFPPRTHNLDGKWAYLHEGMGARWVLRLDTVGDAVRGELGVLRFSRGQYTLALDALLKSGFWEDAAYVAERVLTPAELKAYVDRAWPPAKGRQVWLPVSMDWEDADGPPVRASIRYLLARRLARIGRWQDARAYFPSNLRAPFDGFVRAVAEGRDAHRSRPLRAEALWRAARIARKQGMEVLGTELSPDWAVNGGDYGDDQRERTAQLRLAGACRLAPFTGREGRRVRRHVPRPNARFHYRYTAANLAWEAAELMPDQSDHTARVLATAGTWLKNRDPKAADRFYKALVRRCGKTALGREADRIRWFPRVG